MELLLVLLVIWAVITPPLTLVLFWRQATLRAKLENLTEAGAKQADALHREIAELKRQVAAAPRVAESSAVHIATANPAAPHPVVVPPATTTVPPTSVVAKPEEKKPEPVVAPPLRQQPAPHSPEQVPTRASSPAPYVGAPTEHKTPPLAAPTEIAKPPIAPPIPQHQPPQSQEPGRPPLASPPTPPQPPRQTAPPTILPPLNTARVSSPPPVTPLRASTPKPSPQQRMKSVFALEETLGTNWLNKLGIIILVLGVALFGVYELGQMGPFGKVGLSFVVSFALLGGGIFIEKKERYRVLGHTLIGGGWALLFFTSYALNHVQAMRVMNSETLDLLLMLVVALAMVVHTLRYRSQLVTGLAFLLAYSTLSLSHDDVYSLSSGVILAIGLVSIVIKLGWFELEIFGILSSYLNHLYWLYRLLGPSGAQGHAFPAYHASTAILFFYWLIYRASYIARRPKSVAQEHASTAAALLNTLLLLGVMKFQSVRPELAFIALLAIGAVEFVCAQLPITKRRREAFVVLSVLGAALMIAAVPFRYSGNSVAMLWLVGAEAFLIAGVAVSEVVFRRLGLLIGLLVSAHLLKVDLPQLISARHVSESLVLGAGIMFSLWAIVFYANFFFIGQRWRPFFQNRPDSGLLIAHSYIGGFAAASAAWALCSADWTALGFAAIMLVLAALGRKLNSEHLQLQYGILGLLTLYRVVVFNLHSDAPLHTHIQTRLFTLPLAAAAFYLTAKLVAGKDSSQQAFRGIFAVSGTALITALIYYEVPELWQPVAAIVFAVALLEVGQFVRYHALRWHAHILTALAILAAVTADPAGLLRWHNVPLHAFAALPVIAGAYWIARRISVADRRHVDLARIAYSWAAAGVTAWVLYEAVPAPWIAVSWIAFAIVLALVMRRIAYKHLAWQANVLSTCAIIRLCTYNLSLEQPLWQGISLRLVTVSLVAAGLYFLSRRAAVPGSESSRVVSYLHTSAATALLALLAWYEAPGGWLAAVWAIFALVLALVDRHFELEELSWQVHALAALAILRAVTVNLSLTETWHGLSIRLISLTIVAVIFYALARLVRMPEEWRAREFHHIYSWAASALVALLLWYELQPLSVALGWAISALVLFEYGLLRKTRQFRFQAYLALACSFARIFFINLTAGSPGEFWGPRVYTVAPIALILFFVYAQLSPHDQGAHDDRRLHFDTLLAYLGTATVVSLLYFQFPNDWLVTAWAVAVFVLFVLTLALDRVIFVHQALLLTAAICGRALMHNLFGASYFSDGNWTGRFFVLGSGIAVLFACLPIAFRLRERYRTQAFSRSWITSLMRHLEQPMFFVPVFLLTLMLALKMRAGMVTVSWGVEGVLIILLALAVGQRSFRLTGLGLLLLCVAKIMLRDAWGLAPRDRYVTFIILGAALLLVSFLYSKYRDAIRQLL